VGDPFGGRGEKVWGVETGQEKRERIVNNYTKHKKKNYYYYYYF
jgi:hypothetical protein